MAKTRQASTAADESRMLFGRMRPNAPSLPSPPTWALGALTLLVFLVWSNSFVAMGYLLGTEGAAARFDWITLVPGRYLLVGLVTGLWCLVFRRQEAVQLLRHHPGRALLAAILTVPVYATALLFGQSHGVAAPIASLTTALCPLAVLIMARLFLGEKLHRRQLAGIGLALIGMVGIAAGGTGLSAPIPLSLALIATAIAPIAWAVFTVLSKPVLTSCSPVVWTYTTLALGSLLVLPFAPRRTVSHLAELDLTGWLWLLFLVVPCTTLANAVWAWLLRYLDATIVGLTVFLNPPLTTMSKYLLSRWSPTFNFSLGILDAVGGLIVLLGLAVALRRR